MPAKRSKFLPPPEELTAVLDTGIAVPKRTKKSKLKLMRREHAASPHVLNLQETRPAATLPVSSAPAVSSHGAERRPWAIHLEPEKIIPAVRGWYGHWKTTLGFLAIGLLCVMGLRVINWLAEVKRQDYQVLAQSMQGVDFLRQGTEKLLSDPHDAAVKFQNSLHQLLWAKEDMARFKSFHLSLLGEKKLDAALAVARSFREITLALQSFESDVPNLTDRLANARPHVAAAKQYIAEAARLEPHRAEIAEMRSVVDEQFALLDDAAVALGRDQWKRYLVLFQNNTELRATGGFIGSFAVVDIDRGKIKNIEIPKGGSYDLQGQLKSALAPPKPLQLVKTRWEFQDANWFPDFPTSAQKISWFYDTAGGRTVDGVVAVNTNVLLDLLPIVGPITMPQYGLTIDANNFLKEAQVMVELKYDKTANTPKAFIGDLGKAVLERLQALPPTQYGLVATALFKNLDNKNIIAYTADPLIEQHLVSLGFGGELHPSATNEDYLGIFHTNIAGQKTDQMINESLRYEPTINADGSVDVTLTISRTHEGKKGELFSGVRNVDFVRVYVPQGSTLVRASGFKVPPASLFKDPKSDLSDTQDVVPEENAFAVDLPTETMIYNQFGKTVFANWLQVDPGQTTIASLTYRLPFHATNDYRLFVERQSGMRPQQLTVAVQYNNSQAVVAAAASQSATIIKEWQTILERDTQFSASLPPLNTKSN